MLKPLNERVIVKVEEQEEKTASGLVLPTAAKEKSQVGTVLAVSDAKDDYTPQVKVGDKILFEKYAGNMVKFESEEYLILKEADIAAIIEG